MASVQIRDSTASGNESNTLDDEVLSPTSSSALDRIKKLLKTLISEPPPKERYACEQFAEAQCNILRELQVILIDTQHRLGRVKDDFRRAAGFEALLSVTATVPKLWSALGSDRTVFELLRLVLTILSDALVDNRSNSSYFARHDNVNRWSVLEEHLQILHSTLVCATSSQDDRGPWVRKLFQLLFIFGLRENEHSQVFRPVDSSQQKPVAPQTQRYIVWLPEIFPIALRLSKAHSHATRDSNIDAHQADGVSLLVLSSIDSVFSQCHYNAVALADAGLLDVLMEDDHTYDPDSAQHILMNRLRLKMLQLGCATSSPVLQACKEALRSKEALRLLRDILDHVGDPPHFCFDLSLNGYSSLELAALKGSFPPVERNGGYTLITWLRIDEYDENTHTTLFGACDESQTCFLLLYLERDTRRLVLQTSLAAERPSVRFRSLRLTAGRWCHLAIIHKCPSSDGLGRATLVIDGHVTERVKCAYPLTPRANPASRMMGSHVGAPPQDQPSVQAFVGTPKSLASSLGVDQAHSRWSLASFQLVLKVLPEHLIFIYRNVGPGYVGNFQDSLGSFQTYETSTALNLLHEQSEAGNEAESLIANAIKGRASASNDVQNFAFNLNAGAGCSRGTDSSSANERHQNVDNHLSIFEGYPNLAFSEARSGLQDPSKYVHPHGGVKLARLKPTSNHIWRLCGGVSFAMSVLDAASEHQTVLDTVKIIFHLVRDNWRMSEAFEREGAFAMMALLLRSKAGSLRPTSTIRNSPKLEEEPFQLRLLKVILENVGYNAQDPTLSVISNPLAYRALIVDADIWRSSDDSAQALYYTQYVDFIARSKHQQFNVKRLSRMRPVKRLINALKSEQFSWEGLPAMLDSLRSFLTHMPSSEAYRSVALYITYATSFTHRRLNISSVSSRRHRPSAGSLPPGMRKTQSIQSLRSTDPNTAADKPSPSDIGVRVLEMLAHLLCEDRSGVHIRRFARTVTSKWILYLLSSEIEPVISPAMSILARLLVLQGSAYVAKFKDSTNEMSILRIKLRRWWHLDDVWTCCLAVIFGIDIIHLKLEHSFDPASLAQMVASNGSRGLYCSSMFTVVAGLLETAASATPMEELCSLEPEAKLGDRSHNNDSPVLHDSAKPDKSELVAQVLQTLNLVHKSSSPFRKYCEQSNLVREMLRSIFARLSGMHSGLSPREGALIRDPHNLDNSATIASNSTISLTGLGSSIAGDTHSSFTRRRRHSSFVLVPTKENIQALRSSSNVAMDMPPPEIELIDAFQTDQILLPSTHLLTDVFSGLVMDRADFTGLGLFLKAPPCSFELRASVNSYLIREIMHKLTQALQSEPQRFHEPRILMNIVKFAMQCFEALTEGWFVHGALNLADFIASFIEHWQQPEVQEIKDIRLCNPSLEQLRVTLASTSIYHVLKSGDSSQSLSRLYAILHIQKWHDAISAPNNEPHQSLRALFFAMQSLLPDVDESELQSAKVALWVVAKSQTEELVEVFDGDDIPENAEIAIDLLHALESRWEDFQVWLSLRRDDVRQLATYATQSVLDPFIAHLQRSATVSVDTRSARRKERVEQWHLEDLALSHSWTEHQLSARNWTENIARSEAHKYTRSLQDQHESSEYLKFTLEKLMEPLGRLGLARSTTIPTRWQLDECEGRDRMRLRLSPVAHINETGYEPKSTKTERRKTQSKGETRPRSRSSTSNLVPPRPRQRSEMSGPEHELPEPHHGAQHAEDASDEHFEIISEQPIDDEEEDKNRKVMRSLQRGEKVVNVFNVSRIVGLEAHEGLLIIGRSSLYLIDGLFQRSDGEVVNVHHGPIGERDQYTRILSGHELEDTNIAKQKFEPTRHWPWSEILSLSKRQFLTRPVAIEVFFTDGRSYLLTAAEEAQRDTLYTDLLKSTSKMKDMPQVENEFAWRKDLLKNPGEGTSRLSQILSPMIANPMTKRWVKGEVSNFHYLMWVNSQAGRTFNDLTQYPVFPWIIADYTSEELDLTNPRSFRDLSKPMGCQTIERAESFKERYSTLAEMDDQSPPFHYGTHYSSAMIVTSFLIRLQPFVQSHVLLQGGSFDHANRLFHSIEQAWRSASREGLSDVRELIPEFFFLPDFLRNINCYDFGYRQGDNENVNHVKLPPWAKGDPNLFIAKHREALESPYASQNLHSWIDLIFGFKQRGEAAREATNVFHYLSYPGAKDLDTITDQHERAATIGIIHNFGQTPRQIFLRPHDRREQSSQRGTRLRDNMKSLARLRSPVQELKRAVGTLHFSKQLLAMPTGSCIQLPSLSITAHWDSADATLHFWSQDRRRMLGLYEQLHDGAITCATFADSTLLLTGADDGTVAAWMVDNSKSDMVNMLSKSTLFGHRSAVNHIAVSRAFSILLTGSSDGTIVLWDLGRLDFIREFDLRSGITCATISDSSGRLLFSQGSEVHLYNINGHRLLSQNVCDAKEAVSTCGFYQQSTNAWVDTEIVLTGHTSGVVKVWNITTSKDGVWILELLNRLPTDRFIKGVGTPSITAVLALEQKVWAGDSKGCVYEWNAVR